MKKRSKQALIIIFVLMLSLSMINLQQDGRFVYSLEASDFTDVAKDYWGYSYIDFSANHDVINGYLSPDGTYQFLPEKAVTREEAITMLYRALTAAGKLQSQDDYSAEYSELLTENKIAQWAYPYVSYGLKYKIITAEELAGFTDENGLGISAPREQVGAWTAKAVEKNLAPAYSLIYTDKDSISEDKIPYVDLLYRLEIMQGDDTKSFHPDSGIKRAEFAAISNRVYTLATSDDYQVDKETQSYRGTIVSVDSINNKLMMTQSDGTSRVIQINSKTEIVIDGKLNYNGIGGINTGQDAVIAWGAFFDQNESAEDHVMQVHVITKTQIRAGLLSEMKEINSSTSLLKIQNSNHDLIYYILDENSQTAGTLKKGQEISFIADGVKILEIK